MKRKIIPILLLVIIAAPLAYCAAWQWSLPECYIEADGTRYSGEELAKAAGNEKVAKAWFGDKQVEAVGKVWYVRPEDDSFAEYGYFSLMIPCAAGRTYDVQVNFPDESAALGVFPNDYVKVTGVFDEATMTIGGNDQELSNTIEVIRNK